MAYYQFSLPMTTSESYQIIKTVCERSCTIKQDCPNESIEVRTRFRMGKGSLPFVFYLRELEDGTEIMVSSDNATLTGALAAMNGNKPESVWDLPDKEWSDLIEDFRKEYPAFPLQVGKPVPVAAEPCDDGMGQERGELLNRIIPKLEKRDAGYQARWGKIWEDALCQKYKRPDQEEHWIWNFDFYNGPVEDLRYIAALIGA
mgnify:FL=1